MGPIDPFVRSMLDKDRSSAASGFTVLSADGGEAVVESVVVADAANGHGIGHGGSTFSLADTAFACAANSVLAGSVTAEATISFLAPTRVGDTLLARASVRHRAERQLLVDVTVFVRDRVVAEFRGRAVAVAPRRDT